MTTKKTFWPTRLPRTISAPAMSVWHNLAISALRYPKKPAMVYLGEVWTYERFKSASEVLAGRLLELGVRRGDRVLVDMQNSPQLELTFYAILRLDAVVVPVNPMNKAEELAHYIVDSGARVAIATADLCPIFAQANQSIAPECRVRQLIATQYTDAFDASIASSDDLPPAWKDWLLTRYPVAPMDGCEVHLWSEIPWEQGAPVLPDVACGPDDLVVLPYTSGTTGLPKGCMHTHASIMHNIMASSMWSQGTAQNVALCVAPMFHITGMMSSMHVNIYLGATQVIMPRWHRDVAGHLITRWRVTHFTGIPTMVIDLLGSARSHEFDLTSLVYMAGGGAAMPEAIAQQLWDKYGLRFIEGYGLTETAGGVHGNPPDRPKKQCLGIPLFGVDTRIVDQETPVEVADGEAGEIVINSPSLFHGYWKNPEATAASFLELDGKPFFRSGDIGRVDEDGYFFMTDRLKRMINASGFKVWPAEVEALLYKHPAIQEVCVVGTVDSYRGESVKAVIVLKDSHKAQASEQEIVKWCRDHMAVYKAPSRIEFVDALPKSSSGKVQWRLIQESGR